MQFKNGVQLGKNLKVTRIVTQKQVSKTVWIFQHSLYQIHIIDVSAPYPHHKICLQHPLQHFDVIQYLNHSYIVVVNSLGAWIAYDIQLQPKSQSLSINLLTQSMLESLEHKTIGVHLMDKQKMMILFVQDTGKLEYNYLNSTLRINKSYSTEPQNKKYQGSSLFSKYRGRSLLETQADSQNRILLSTFSLATNQLYVVTEDISSKVCSILRFFLQQYEVIAGSDFLLNLDSRPVQILLIDRVAVVNLGKSMLLWGRNLADVEKYGEDGLCTSLTQLDKNTLMGCIAKLNQTCIYWITVTANQKQAKTVCTIKHKKIHTISQQIIQYTAIESQKANPSLWVTNKLEIIAVDKDNNQRIIVSNMSATIVQAKMYSSRYCNYLDVVKKVGYGVERKLVSHNRVVVGVDEYQHNMLIKMGTIVSYGVKDENAILCMSSPIIGTLKLSLGFIEQGKRQKATQSKFSIVLSIGNMQSNLSAQQQSLYLNSEKNQQITPTKLSLAKSRYSISDMFQGKIDFILSACIVGNYALMAVEKQVHVFIIEPKPKRLHIYCLDAQLKTLISLNDVNLWGALLWDGSLLVLRVDEKESIKIKQVNDVRVGSNQSCMQYNSVINTAPYRSTIVGEYLVICSNDPLHAYQPEKTSVRCLVLPRQWMGQEYYPIIQMPASSQGKPNSVDRYRILCNKENVWMIASFPIKCLVKDIDEIKIELELIVGLPCVEGLIACFTRENTIVLFSGSKIVICALQSGSITYQTMSTFQSQLPQSVNASRSEYLQRWVDRQQVSVESVKVEGDNQILSTNPCIVKLNQSRILLYNRKQIWYATMSSDRTQKVRAIKLISYFSIPNDAFLQFRNNLSISELENDAFMQMFAEKLPILEIYMINQTLFAVLYSRMIVVVEIKNNGAMAINQQLLLSSYPQIIAIKHFVGKHDELSLYLKDTSQRLILLRWHKDINKYTLEVVEQVEDDVICIFKVQGWKDNIRKVGFKGQEQVKHDQIIVRKDGQLIKTGENSLVYL